MNKEKVQSNEAAAGAVGRCSGMAEQAHASGKYRVECFGPDGKLKWADDIENIVTTIGKNFALDTLLSGSAYTAAWYLGLVSIASYVSVPVLADTSASHTSWTEDQNYSQGARPTATFSAAAADSKTLSSAAVFSINGSTTIKGCFLISVSTKGGTTGTLYSAGLFTGGDKVVASGDTLNVTYTATM